MTARAGNYNRPFQKKRSLHRVHARVPADMPASPRAPTRSHTPSARVSRTNPVFANPASNRTVKSLCLTGSAQSAMPESMPGATVGRPFSGREAPRTGFLPTVQMLCEATKRPVKSQPRRPPQQCVSNATDMMMRMQNTKNEVGHATFLWGRGEGVAQRDSRWPRAGGRPPPCWAGHAGVYQRALLLLSEGPRHWTRVARGSHGAQASELLCMYPYSYTSSYWRLHSYTTSYSYFDLYSYSYSDYYAYSYSTANDA